MSLRFRNPRKTYFDYFGLKHFLAVYSSSQKMFVYCIFLKVFGVGIRIRPRIDFNRILEKSFSQKRVTLFSRSKNLLSCRVMRATSYIFRPFGRRRCFLPIASWNNQLLLFASKCRAFTLFSLQSRPSKFMQNVNISAVFAIFK